MIYWEEYGRKWGTEAATELHSLEEALSRKNRKERTDGGSQGSERRGTVGTCWQLLALAKAGHNYWQMDSHHSSARITVRLGQI